MRLLLPLRTVPAALAILFAIMPALAQAEDGSPERSPAPAPSIVIGFVGGFVHHDNPHHGPVQLAKRIQQAHSKDVYVEVFENRHRKNAYQRILRLLDTNHDGRLSEAEKGNAHILLFGHSWGASAAVLLARDLQRSHIPVRLTVQVDSVAKLWQDDSLIPANVAEAANFYQTHGLVHGRARITPTDSSLTQILGNYRFDYKKNPVHCSDPSWFDRHIAPAHAQSECDPQLWLQVENLIGQRLSPTSNAIAANPRP